jgi:hypothetical protein
LLLARPVDAIKGEANAGDLKLGGRLLLRLDP